MLLATVITSNGEELNMKTLAALMLIAGLTTMLPEPPEIKVTAQNIIRMVVEELTPEYNTQVADHLTGPELKALGRYLETPSLEEVYPGIKEALQTPYRVKG